jgi:hypothetical protein
MSDKGFKRAEGARSMTLYDALIEEPATGRVTRTWSLITHSLSLRRKTSKNVVTLLSGATQATQQFPRLLHQQSKVKPDS